jgi:hypothetical protein
MLPVKDQHDSTGQCAVRSRNMVEQHEDRLLPPGVDDKTQTGWNVLVDDVEWGGLPCLKVRFLIYALATEINGFSVFSNSNSSNINGSQGVLVGDAAPFLQMDKVLCGLAGCGGGSGSGFAWRGCVGEYRSFC